MNASQFDTILSLELNAFQDSKAREAFARWPHECEDAPNGWLVCRAGNGLGIAYSLSSGWNDAPWCVVEDIDSEDPNPAMYASTLEECVQEILYAGETPNVRNQKAREELMAESRRLREASRQSGALPRQGETFAILHKNGLYSICRVVIDAESKKYPDQPAVLVFGGAWFGGQIPNISDPRLKDVLRLTHNKWKGKPHRSWISGPVPEDFIAIGTIEPSPEELETRDRSMADWDFIRIHALMQWEWDQANQ